MVCGQSVDGANTLFGDYSSSQGENVLASFGTNSYPGEQDPTLDLAWSAGGNLLLMGAGAGLTKGMMYLDDVASGFGVFGRGVDSSPGQFRFFEVPNNAVELPVTLHQQKELSLLTAQTRNDLANDFDLLINELTPNQIDAIAEHPWTMRLFFGSAVESRVAGQIDNLVLDNPSHVLSDLTWTRRTNAPQDFYTLDGYGFDITGNSPASIFKHQSRPEIDSLVTYDSIPNDLGYRFINWLENN